MKCKNHIESDSCYVCTVCGEPLCGSCTLEIGKSIYCSECLENIVQKRQIRPKEGRGWFHSLFYGDNGRKSKPLAMIYSLIPGTGHLYLGMIKKGVALMSLLFSLIFLVILFTDSSDMSWLAGYLIPTICFLFLSYSIFDCMVLADRINSGEDVHDEGIYELTLLKELVLGKRILFSLLSFSISIIIILKSSFKMINLAGYSALAADFPITGIVVSLVLIILGITFLVQGRRRRI